MNILDNIDQINQIDKSNVYGSILGLSKQCSHAWQDTKNINIPDSYKNINKIILTGMGGSGLGARIIESVYSLTLKLPLTVIHDYDLPIWTDEKTLVICSSFSGTTEETVENAHQAQKFKSKWMAIGTGGTLIDFAQKCNVPYYQIIPTHNPSKQPRMANGYSVVGQLCLVSKIGVIDFVKDDLSSLIQTMELVVKQNKVEVSQTENQAKKFANQLFSKAIVFIGSRHTLGAIHLVKNQMNENSKNFSLSFDVPEMNHHLLEGLAHPKNNEKYLLFVFVNSQLYPQRIQKRFLLTQEIIKKYKIPYLEWQATSRNELSQAFEFIQFGSFLNFYLGILSGIDPAPIPWVDYFKIKLGQPLGQWK